MRNKTLTHRHTVANDIAIDPITLKEFHDAVGKAYNDFTNEIDFDTVRQMDFEEALQMFFANGFLHGSMNMTDNPDLQETIHMMTKEIDYQTK